MTRGKSVLVWAGALALVFGAKPVVAFLLPAESRLHNLLEYGLEHLGVVLVVALVIRATLEAASQSEFLNVVNEQLRSEIKKTTKAVAEESIHPLGDAIKSLTTNLSYRISKFLDAPLRKQLEDSVLNATFFRPEYKLHLKLEPLGGPHPIDGAELLKVYIVLSYEVVNVSEKPASYTVESWLDDVIQPAKTVTAERSRFNRIAFSEHKPLQLPYSVSDLEDGGHIKRENGTVRLHLTTEAVQPGCHLFVEVEGAQLMRAQDHFIWNLVTLTQKLDIVVELMEGLTFDKFDVWPREMHHLGHEAFRHTYKTTDNVFSMTIDQVLLPFQGIELRWSPRLASEAARTGAAAPVSAANPAPPGAS